METKALAAESSIDRSLTKEEALKNSILATELYMKGIKLASSDHERARLRDKCKELLARAEEIKKLESWPPPKSVATILNLKVPISQRAVSRSEEIILLEGSKLHGFIFPPWTAEPEDKMFDEGGIYTEPSDLELSGAQREIFAGWKRASDTFRPPSDSEAGNREVSMTAVHEIDLVQDITTDCSVVASLCASTVRALKGHGKLLASSIYPHDKTSLRPRLSKNGKYIFRLHFNGCQRKVTIDDRLPASNTSRSLHVVDRRNPTLLWPALIEKAYLKIRGGYDFPGSNSGTDLWVMTGWIPEQVFLQSDDLQSEVLWHRILKAFSFGDVMITLGTGKLTHCEENELGLAGEHDYAVLDMKETGSQRLLLIKNPWCDGMVWKGSRSHPSEPSWPSELREALPETTETATRPEAQGTFWLSLNDTIQHFESLYLNWNPGLFTHRQDHHFTWTMPPISVPGSFTHNPQYSVTSTVPTTVWVLLSRHFQTAEQGLAKAAAAGTAAGTNAASGGSGANALGYISLYVFAADGARVHLSDNALHRGAYVDSPQTLAVLTLPAHTAHTVVCASQGLPLPKYAFTLSFFARSPLAVAAAPDALPHRLSVAGAWTARTAGGNAGAASYACNPQFALTVPATTDLALFLETEREEVAVHVQLVWGGGARVAAVAGRDVVGGSGDYRRGCALATLRGVAGGVYAVVCSTFEPGQLGRFTLRIGSGVECTARPVLAEGAGKLVQRLPLARFRVGCVRMLAPLSVVRLVRLMVVARGVGRRAMLRVSLEQGLGPGRVVLGQSNAGEFSDALVGSRVGEVDVGPEMGARGGAWVVVERLGGEVEGEVEVEVLSDGVVVVGVWGSGEE